MVVVSFDVKAFDANKKLINNVPISFSFNGRIHFSRTPEIPYGKDFAKVNVLGDEYRFDAVDFGLPASAEISHDGKFVAETPGVYTIYATTGGVSSYASINSSSDPNRDHTEHSSSPITPAPTIPRRFGTDENSSAPAVSSIKSPSV